MPALETQSPLATSPISTQSIKSAEQPLSFSLSLSDFANNAAIAQQRVLVQSASPHQHNSTTIHRPASPLPVQSLHHTADISAFVHPITSQQFARPSTSPASLSSRNDATLQLTAELRDAHEQLLIQKHAIAAALGAELTALKDERIRERRQHAVVMRRMEEEVRRVEERANLIEEEKNRVEVELAVEKEGREHDRKNQEQAAQHWAIEEAQVENQQSNAEVDEWDEHESEQAAETAPVFHSQPPSSRPSISCPQPIRQASIQPSMQASDEPAIEQLLDTVQQLRQQIAVIRQQTAQHSQFSSSNQYHDASEAVVPVTVHGPGSVWRQYQPLAFRAVQPIVFHRTQHYSHYDVREWGRPQRH